MAARRALIIDDEPDIIAYHGTLLADNGWEVESANNGNDGLAQAAANPPDLVLLDVMMPERGGLSTLIGLRKEPSLSGVKVVLVTGVQESLTSDYEAFLGRFKAHHPDGYVEKPVEPEALLKLIDELVPA